MNRELYGESVVNGSQREPDSEVIDVEAVLAILRRQWVVVAACMAAGLLLGLVYLISAVPLYTSQISVLIDRSNKQFADQLTLGGGVLDDEGSVLSQVELLKSETIALSVVDKLKLVDDPQFQASFGSLYKSVYRSVVKIFSVSQWFSSDDIDTGADIEQRKRDAAAGVQGNIDVTRVGRSYVLTVEYVSPFPGLSQKIANALGDAYLEDSLNSKYEATRRASNWLLERIAELRQQALDTDLAVQKFKSANGLVTAGDQLVSDQQLSELNSALIVAQSDVAKSKAKLQRIEQIIASGQTDAIVSDVLDSSISNELRTKYLNASKLEAQISAKLGPRHVQAVRLRAEMDEYKRLMFDELNRIAQGYRSEVDVAEAREKTLAASVAEATGVSATANETMVQLRELEREAETYRNLYQTFLQRYQEAVQQQSFPLTDARIISRASEASRPSHPKKIVVLAGFLALGIFAGAGVGAFREFRDRFFRVGDQIRSTLGLEFLGTAPLMAENAAYKAEPVSDPRTVAKFGPIYDYVVDHPLSSFAETLRNSKIAVDLACSTKKTKVIGIISTLPGEGKSTIAVNFAELLAAQGARTTLIDADLRNPGATRALAQHAQAGILEAILGNQDLGRLCLVNPRTGLRFLPAVIKQRVPHSSELLSSPGMKSIISRLSEVNDYIIVDLPPLAPVVDARAFAGTVDAFLFVVEWGKVSRRLVRQSVEADNYLFNKCVGVILNKVDQGKQKLYQKYGSSEYYYRTYSKYYNENA
ncbi:polysaccharide biosynthesis tyrosine autokinase [Rhizobium daejeonense]|uniref:Polysaccharide biosynthesis tyrosine autokinase n=2 Tax=Rhizobium daejeonense TaxID=240521 RepID=A0A6M1SA12_9HYPH|nr:polysaccharide biosynthesis tyrosine autokinase [Rhizobium daejeonense]NGO65128.1 polysaccharide biosynthesis tyrosine autokinase [Rhizobium daejeonense]